MEIKETTEIIEAFGAITIFLARRFKDGADNEDAKAIFEKLKDDDIFQELMAEAWRGRKNALVELDDLDMLETFELGKQFVQLGFEIIDVLK